MNIRDDFPIFKNNPGLVFLDSTASSQKPSYVIDGIKRFLENDYSNIHRGMYSLAERSEEIYEKSKKKVCEMIGGKDWREVIYTFNSNYALNLLSLSLKRTGWLKKWDVVLVSIVEHHANIVPWLILKEEIGIEVQYIAVKEDFSLDMEDLRKKLTPEVKVVSITQVSNVTWEVFPVEEIWKILKQIYPQNTPFFVIDASQSVPHLKVDVRSIWCDFVFFTWHKIFADSGIGVLWWRKELLEKMHPGISWGGAISKVTQDGFISTWLPDRFEAGTPNVTWAASMLYAFEYVEKIWWYPQLENIEKELVLYTIERFQKMWAKSLWKNVDDFKKGDIVIFGSLSPIHRVWVFSFLVWWVHSHDISEFLAEKNICIRAWQHCAEPFLETLDTAHTCRMSLHIYNTKEDIDSFFTALWEAVEAFKNL